MDMQNSILAIVVALLWLVLPLFVFYKFDVRLLAMTVRSLGKYTGGLLVLGALLWLVWQVGSWWLSLAWLLGVVVVAAFMIVKKARVEAARWCWPLAGSMLAALLLVGGTLVWALPDGRWCLPFMAVLLAQMVPSLVSGLHVYTSSMRHTELHREYLLGNGATRFESLVPSLRRAVRAALLPWLHRWSVVSLLTLPLVLSGLLMGGMTPVDACVLTLVLAVASLSASVLALSLTLWLVERK